jgi:hypothetical protein
VRGFAGQHWDTRISRDPQFLRQELAGESECGPNGLRLNELKTVAKNCGTNRIDRSAEAVGPGAGQVRQMRCWESSEEMVTGS